MNVVDPSEASLVDLVDQRAAISPDRVLMVDDRGASLTCRHFAEETIRVANRFAAAGVGSGSVVSWILPTGIDALVVMVALARTEAVQNPIIPAYREREIGHIMGELEVDAIVTVPSWRGIEYLELCQELAAARGVKTAVLTIADVMRGETGLASVGRTAHQRELGGTRWVFYTSGTTSNPKGVRHTDASLAAAATGMVEHMAMSEADGFGIAFPIAHIGGAINLMATLLSGARVILIEHFDREASTAALAREGVTMAGSGTAFHLAYLEMQAAQPDTPLFPALRCCPGGGAPKPPGLHARVKQELGGLGIISSWGLTEAPVLTMGRPTDPDSKLADTEGRPLPGVQLRAVAPDGHTCQPGEPGELRVRAGQQMLGYVDASLDADAFDDDGFVRTGDVGVIDADGYVKITGRIKDVIIRKGENVSAAEVEQLLRSHPDIADAAVIGVPDAQAGERVCAVVQMVEGRRPVLDAATLGSYLEREGLRRIAWPEQVEVMASLPRTVAGKIDKEALKGQFGAIGRPLDSKTR
jgi:acyl-CoA synthetase (AMP-forming)/AMP-acid ligase II